MWYRRYDIWKMAVVVVSNLLSLLFLLLYEVLWRSEFEKKVR